MTPDRLAEIKHNLEHAGRTHYRDVSDLLTDNTALREAVRVLGEGIIAVRHQRAHERKNRLVPGGAVSSELEQACVNIMANPLAAAAVREAKEQA